MQNDWLKIMTQTIMTVKPV